MPDRLFSTRRKWLANATALTLASGRLAKCFRRSVHGFRKLGIIRRPAKKNLVTTTSRRRLGGAMLALSEGGQRCRCLPDCRFDAQPVVEDRSTSIVKVSSTTTMRSPAIFTRPRPAGTLRKTRSMRGTHSINTPICLRGGNHRRWGLSSRRTRHESRTRSGGPVERPACSTSLALFKKGKPYLIAGWPRRIRARALAIRHGDRRMGSPPPNR